MKRGTKMKLRKVQKNKKWKKNKNNQCHNLDHSVVSMRAYFVDQTREIIFGNKETFISNFVSWA